MQIDFLYLNHKICDQAFFSVFRRGRNKERLIVKVYASHPFAARVCGFTKQKMNFICRSSHWYSIPCGDDPIGPALVTFLRVFSMGEGRYVIQCKLLLGVNMECASFGENTV